MDHLSAYHMILLLFSFKFNFSISHNIISAILNVNGWMIELSLGVINLSIFRLAPRRSNWINIKCTCGPWQLYTVDYMRSKLVFKHPFSIAWDVMLWTLSNIIHIWLPRDGHQGRTKIKLNVTKGSMLNNFRKENISLSVCFLSRALHIMIIYPKEP